MLWCSALTSLNNDLLNDGVILKIYNKVISLPVVTSFTFRFTQTTNAKNLLTERAAGDADDLPGRTGWETQSEMKG